MARVGRPLLAASALFCALLVGSSGAGQVEAPASGAIVLWADRDDDDADGRPDGDETPLPPAARADAVPVGPALVGLRLEAVRGGDHARVLSSEGAVVPWGASIPPRAILQGLSPGLVTLVSTGSRRGTTIDVDVLGLELRDGRGQRVDLTSSQASIERTPPEPGPASSTDPFDDPDATRVVVQVPETISFALLSGLGAVTVRAYGALGQVIDALPRLPLERTTCPEGAPTILCLASAPLRVVMDDVDRTHPLAAARSVKGQVGGAILFESAGRKAQAVRVLGPRGTPAGPIARLRATLRPFVVRVAPGAAPAIGGNEAGAIDAVRSELASAAGIWGQCGITFGDLHGLDVHIVDPPPAHLVSIGDDLGVGASGGGVRLRVNGKSLALRTHAAESVEQAALELARAADRAGLEAIVSPNARIAPGAGRSVDVSFRRRDHTLANVALEPRQGTPFDPTLSLRIGSVDLADGLQHFTDMDSMAGTLEERTLIKAFDDGDPTTIEVLVVPLFAEGGRIGESFISSDSSSVRNVVLLDRAGIRTRKSSLTLAHELGHVLMDMPGHPDDYGIDTPTQLMDSDAADASPFGPRRLSLDECARAVRQTGPGSRIPLLSNWPIGSLKYDPRQTH